MGEVMKIYKKLCLVAVALTCAVINYSGCANGSDSNSAAEVNENPVIPNWTYKMDETRIL